MKPGLVTRLRLRARRARNRTLLGAKKVRLSITLAALEVPRRVRRSIHILHRDFSWRRAVTASALAAAIVLPSVLYLVERDRRLEQKADYHSMLLEWGSETGFLQQSIRNLQAEHSRLTHLLLEDGHVLRNGSRVTVKVVATGYSSSVIETDDTPFITAANTPTREGILALSRDLLREYTPGAPFSFGDRVHIHGVGDFLVEDSMNKRWLNRADVWFPSRMDALRFGAREVYLTAQSDYDETEDDEESSPRAGL